MRMKNGHRWAAMCFGLALVLKLKIIEACRGKWRFSTVCFLIGMAMLTGMAAFLAYAITHQTANMPFSIETAHAIYRTYIGSMLLVFLITLAAKGIEKVNNPPSQS